jgi:uncharacterized protein YecE (DUF72 family)
MKVHLGCSGWYYWRWKGSFYPADLPTRQWFQRYARAFKTVEMNSTYYHWPRPATIRGWAKQAPSSFRYAIKVNGEITHERRMKSTKRLIQKFSQIADELGPKFGCFLYQFPPSFRYTPGRLKAILTQVDLARVNAVEFRHPSWWRKVVYRAFARARLIFSSVSAPRLPDEIVRTGPAIYLRFHGKSRWYSYDYSKEELSDWAAKIRRSRAREAWIYFNNDQNGCAVRNARQLARALVTG